MVIRRRLSRLAGMALLVAAIGCSAASPAEVAHTPDIEATVEARVQATSEAAAAIQATAGLLEEFNRVERACLMHSSHLESGSEFATSLVLLEFSQEDQATLRRTFGNRTALAQKVIMGAFCQFKGMEPITNFFANHGVETAFRSFLSEGRSTSGQLTKELNRILNAREADPHGPEGTRFEAVFATPQQAVSAAMQPYLATLAPRMRHGARQSIMDEWSYRIALNPEQFQSQDSIVKIFEEFRERGFLNTAGLSTTPVREAPTTEAPAVEKSLAERLKDKATRDAVRENAGTQSP